jgi:hypothetical protein
MGKWGTRKREGYNFCKLAYLLPSRLDNRENNLA